MNLLTPEQGSGETAQLLLSLLVRNFHYHAETTTTSISIPHNVFHKKIIEILCKSHFQAHYMIISNDGIDFIEFNAFFPYTTLLIIIGLR